MTAEEIYHQHIRSLPAGERLRLLELTARDLATESDAAGGEPPHDIMELYGLGKEIWEGIDAQEYVNSLRAEWDHRP